MKKILMKIRCALFGHDFEVYQYAIINPDKLYKTHYGLRCMHCGKVLK